MKAITFDIDWAPDWAIEMCADLCRKHEVKATFFVTHRSDILEDLRKDALFELGIHPNFLAGSTQGSDVREVIDYCLNVVPEASAMRTHALYQTSCLFKLIVNKYPAILADVSLFLPLHPGLQPTKLYFNENKKILRLPSFWEDDFFILDPNCRWQDFKSDKPGLKIYNSHPIHVALNTNTLEGYERLSFCCSPMPLYQLTRQDAFPFQNNKQGVQTFLKNLLRNNEKNDFFLISEIIKKGLE